MNLKYKIIAVDTSHHTMAVRYYTDIITEDMLCIARAPTGEIVSCATDYNFSMPIPVPEGQPLIDFITQRAPIDYLMTREAVLNPQVDTSMAPLTPLVGVENLQSAVQTLDTRSPLEKAVANKLQDIASWRYAKEVGGLDVGGVVVKTDRDSQSQIGDTLSCFQNQFISEVQWKGANGWVTLTSAQMHDIAAAVAVHVQSCFAQERQFAEQVAAATTVEQVAAIVLPTIVIPAQVA